MIPTSQVGAYSIPNRAVGALKRWEKPALAPKPVALLLLRLVSTGSTE
jgi:DNA-binding transcriptional regulator YiaG